MTLHQHISAVQPHVAKLTTVEFQLLARSGAFEDYARSELIEGEIIVVNAQYRRHFWARRQLVRAFDAALGQRADNLIAADECSVALSNDNQPQPDIVLTDEPQGDGPIPLSSVKLVIEIADSTVETDMGRKRALYARHGVPEYWVVDIEGRAIHQMWRPSGEAYIEQRTLAFGDRIEAATLAGVSVETGGLG